MFVFWFLLFLLFLIPLSIVILTLKLNFAWHLFWFVFMFFFCSLPFCYHSSNIVKSLNEVQTKQFTTLSLSSFVDIIHSIYIYILKITFNQLDESNQQFVDLQAFECVIIATSYSIVPFVFVLYMSNKCLHCIYC